jgi:hypothetical protein
LRRQQRLALGAGLSFARKHAAPSLLIAAGSGQSRIFERQFRAHERAERLDGEVDVLRGHVTNQEGQPVATEIPHHAKQRHQALGVLRGDLLGVIHTDKGTFVPIWDVGTRATSRQVLSLPLLVDALADGDAVEQPVEPPEVLLGGDVAGHGGRRRYDQGELVGRGGGERLVPGGDPLRRGR